MERTCVFGWNALHLHFSIENSSFLAFCESLHEKTGDFPWLLFIYSSSSTSSNNSKTNNNINKSKDSSIEYRTFRINSMGVSATQEETCKVCLMFVVEYSMIHDVTTLFSLDYLYNLYCMD